MWPNRRPSRLHLATSRQAFGSQSRERPGNDCDNCLRHVLSIPRKEGQELRLKIFYDVELGCVYVLETGGSLDCACATHRSSLCTIIGRVHESSLWLVECIHCTGSQHLRCRIISRWSIHVCNLKRTTIAQDTAPSLPPGYHCRRPRAISVG